MNMLIDLLRTDPLFARIPGKFLASLARDGDFETITTMAIRMIFIVAAIAGFRKACSWLYETALHALFPTAYIAVTDPSYLWVMAWLAQDPSAQKQISDFQLSTEEWRQVRKFSGSALRRSAETNKGGTIQSSSPSVGEQNASWAEGEIIGQIIPAYLDSIRLQHEGKHLWVKRQMACFARTRLRSVDHIQIRTLCWQKDVLKRFLVAAHQSYFAKEDRELLIFNANRIAAGWHAPVSRPVRPWSSVILPDNMKEDLISDIGKFLSDKEVQWYAARGIPHRRGYLFHGTPGSGKTTLATAVASKLHLDIYVVNPSQRGMDDAKLSKLFRVCPARSVILIEDIDCIFPRNRGRNNVTMDGSDGEPTSSTTDVFDDIPNESPVTPMFGGKHDLAPSTVTLSGLLNAIDGVSSQEGCILIASTNHPERLDPALSRAGRFDVHLAFSHASRAQARALFLHFYPLEDFLALSEKPAQVITCQEDIDELADKFSDIIQEGEGGEDGTKVSMAALQGYLLRYKEDPHAAADNASRWIEDAPEAGSLQPTVGTSLSLSTAPTDQIPQGSPSTSTGLRKRSPLSRNKSASRKNDSAVDVGDT